MAVGNLCQGIANSLSRKNNLKVFVVNVFYSSCNVERIKLVLLDNKNLDIVSRVGDNQ